MSGNIHVNPCHSSRDAKNKILINPKFMASSEQPTPKVFVNPNYGRPLPAIPEVKQCYVNPSFYSQRKAKTFDESVKAATESKVIYLNPEKLQAANNESPNSSSSEKENVTKNVASSSSSRNIFKKIGTRKLIRVKSTNPKPEAAKLHKIGTRKLIRVNSPRTPQAKKCSKSNTPRRLFSTPFSLSRMTKKRPKSPSPLHASAVLNKRTRALSRFSNLFSPLRSIDRRQQQQQQQPKDAAHLRPTSIAETPSSCVLISAACSPAKPVAPKKPVRKMRPDHEPKTLINVHGVRYAVSENGRKLNRIAPKAPLQPAPVSETAVNPVSSTVSKEDNNKIIPKKLFLDGEEYVEDEPGVLIRSRNSMTRQSITSYKQRSINTILKSQTRCKQYCMFYNKFGKCNKKDKGVCPYIHDSSKVAVCRKFLQGNCYNEKCLLSHQVVPDKMPSCKFFLQGLCTRDQCPYRHVQVNENAEVCPDFLKGFCPAATDCKKKHEFHSARPSRAATAQRKVAPTKPKRKSLCKAADRDISPPTPSSKAPLDKKPRLRYYDKAVDDDLAACRDQEDSGSVATAHDDKRKRLLQKVELAKQTWAQTGTTPCAPHRERQEEGEDTDALDDSGPYEQIVDAAVHVANEAAVARTPVGHLPSFISLCGQNNAEPPEEQPIDERLI